MSPNIDLDLDTLSPQPKKIKINGEIIEALPLRVNDIARIETIKDTNDVSTLLDIVEGFVPEIRKANPTIEQLNALIVFITESQGDKKKVVENQLA